MFNLDGKIALVTGNAAPASYVAKAGPIGMSKAFAHEVAPQGVTINLVSPGFIAIPISDDLDEAHKPGRMSHIPLNRIVSAQDAAPAVTYPASDEAAWVTGTTMHVTGGMLMV